jgi:diguanylate cyclase (GGDEF)-like protein/PAS domain S-box-containing protein
MILLDLKTVLFDYVISNAICTAVMISLYLQNRRRAPELAVWVAAFLLHIVGLLMIFLRGVIPDFLSIVLGNTLTVSNSLVLLFGLERYFHKKASHWINLIILGLFFGLHIYFTFAHPSLLFRTLNFSIFLLIFNIQLAWLLLRRVDIRERPATRVTGFLFLTNSLFSIARIVTDLVSNPGTELFHSGLPDTLIILTYQMLFIALTFTLFLIVNRHLVRDLEDDIQVRARTELALRKSEEKFSKAFHNVPDVLIISRVDDGKILEVNESFESLSGYTRAEALGRTTVELNIWSSAAERQTFVELVRTNGKVRNFETYLHQKSGQSIICLVSGETIQLEQGECFLLLVHDITERKIIEQAERDQRVLAEALRDTATALNSTLKVKEVLERILDNIGRVTPHDTANIMVLQDDNSALIVRSRGYVEHGFPDLTGQRFDLSDMAILKRVAELGRPMAVSDVTADPDWQPTEEVGWVRSYAVAPIRIRQRTIGFINLESAQPDFFNDELANRLQAFADQASIAIENAGLYEDVQALALTDPLTGLFNRRALFQLGEREVVRSQRFHHPLAVIMLDIDHFKAVNDCWGHPNGDRVLAALSTCLRAQIRNVDLAARYGGEEFTLLLPETDQASAMMVAERIRASVSNLLTNPAPDEGTSPQPIQVTISLGVVTLSAETETLVDLIARADQALYAAKNAGRNRVMPAPPERVVE